MSFKVIRITEDKIYLGDEQGSFTIVPKDDLSYDELKIGDMVDYYQSDEGSILVLNSQNNSPKKRRKSKSVFKNPLYLTIGILFLLVIGIVSFLFLSKQPETNKEAEKIAESTRIPKSNERSHSSSSKHQTRSDSNSSVSSTSTSDNRLAASQSESSSSLESREVTESTNISSSPESNGSPLPKENYAAIVGTWRNARGDTLVIDTNGKVMLNGNSGSSVLGSNTLRNGAMEFIVGVPSGAGGFGISYIPAGESITTVYSRYNDQSEINRERLIAGQNLDDNPDYVLYRVSN